MLKQNYLSMALHKAIEAIAQPAISQPPDQEHVGRHGRHAVRKLRTSWANFFGGWGRRTSRYPAADESARRIAAAIAKRERRWARNLRLMHAA